MNLRIKGWRGRTINLALPRRLLLAGPNGSGKTNILDAVEVALTGKAPGRLGDSAARLVPYLDDGATTMLEGADPHWSACASFRKTAKSAKLDHAIQGQPPKLRPLFVDFDGFLDSPAERKRLLDGLLEVAEESVLALAKASAHEAAREVLTPAAKEWTETALDQLPGLSMFPRVALLNPTLDGLNEALKQVKASYTAAKGAADVATSQATEATGRDPGVITAEIADARNTLAKIEAQDRDARAVIARRNGIEGRLATLRAVDPAKRAALVDEVARLEAITPPGSAVLSDLRTKLEGILAQGKAGNTRYQSLKAGKCPTCGTEGPVLASAAHSLADELKALGKQRDEIQAELNAAEAGNATALAEYRAAISRLTAARAELAALPLVDPGEVQRLEEELANLPNAFLSGDELDALRLRVQHLEQEAEVSRASRAALTVVSALNLPTLELAGKAIRAAIKGWEQGKAKAYADVVGPIAKRMAEALGQPVAIDPENNWTITVADRAAESYSGGQRLALWGAFVAALARPGDILLCEAAEADLQRLGLLCAALEKCPADLVIVATHHQPTIAEALGIALGEWAVVNPARVEA